MHIRPLLAVAIVCDGNVVLSDVSKTPGKVASEELNMSLAEKLAPSIESFL